MVNFTFDVLNREITRSYSDTTPEVDTGYDLAGRKTSAKFTNGTGETWAWDLAGRLTSETSTENGSRQVTYAYDAAGNRTKMTWPDAFFVTYAYDADERMSSISDNTATTLVTFAYDDLGRRINLTRLSQLAPSTTYSWDNAGIRRHDTYSRCVSILPRSPRGRLARIVVPGLPHHVTARGNRREPIFFGDGDHEIYRDLLTERACKAGVEVWAYCLMPNHVHLILVPSR